MVLLIMGVSGSGKSSLSKLLADRFSFQYIDADDHHPRANIDKMKGCSKVKFLGSNVKLGYPRMVQFFLIKNNIGASIRKRMKFIIIGQRLDGFNFKILMDKAC